MGVIIGPAIVILLTCYIIIVAGGTVEKVTAIATQVDPPKLPFFYRVHIWLRLFHKHIYPLLHR